MRSGLDYHVIVQPGDLWISSGPEGHPVSEQAAEPHGGGGARAAAETQLCPGCGAVMPALKGARVSRCATCGYKESCCY